MKRLVCLFLIIMVSEVVVEGLSIQARNDMDPCVTHGESYCQYRCRQKQLSGFCNEENRCICYYDPNNFF
ncbi:Hypp5912 [Branchiostoma lanceolatum]|uniref:Hypp5912 protein n=1 Tax=Branchiostoma lanceolatum TaxID=7740 RepID=A0A8J9VGL8_BRALA|nr:Hypp5912 [Branchiostoma lanceolatum]